MSDTTAIITTVAGATAVLLTVTIALHNSTTRQIGAMQTSTNREIDALSESLNQRIDDLGERTTKLEHDIRELRTLWISRFDNQEASEQ